MRKIDFNGELYDALLKGAEIIAYEFKEDGTGVLVRNPKSALFHFSEFETDTNGVFKNMRQCSGSEPTMIKRFREEFNPEIEKPKLPWKPPNRKGWDLKVWESIHGPNTKFREKLKNNDAEFALFIEKTRR